MTALHIGPLTIYYYTILLDLGVICGVIVAYFEAKRLGHDPGMVIDAAFYAILGGVVGGRLYYVALNWPYFATKLSDILQPWKGGLVFHGALLGGVLMLLGYARYRRISFWELADLAAPGLALGGAVAWLGCFVHGSGYGQVTYGLLGYDLPDIYGIRALRYPTQAMMIALNLIVFAILRGLRRRRPFPGFAFTLYLLLYSSGQFLIEFTRGDETVYIGPLRFAQIASLGIFLLALSLMPYLLSPPHDEGK